MRHIARTHSPRLSRSVVIGATLVMATAGGAMACPHPGDGHVEPSGFAAAESLPDIYQELARLRAAGYAAADSPTDLEPAETTPYQFGWHYGNGPVIFTVTTGTLTFADDACQTFDLVAGHTYVVSSRPILDARPLPEKDPGHASVGWFTTRLSPEGAAEPVERTACDVT